jgi:glycosyltransferase involved in cell wall biosynthesis
VIRHIDLPKEQMATARQSWGAERRNAGDPDPLVTIAIPTFNRSPFLRACVKAALEQTYSNIEVFVSNNASTDDTLDVLAKFKDRRLNVWSNDENVGLTANWNNCIARASGKYMAIVSDDNLLSPTFVERCVQLIRKASDLRLVVTGYDVIVEDEKRTIPPVLSKALSTGIYDGRDLLKERLRANLLFGTLSCLMRTKDVRQLGGLSAKCESANEELLLAQLLLEGRAGLVNEALASYVFHSHSTPTHSSTLGVGVRFREFCEVMDEIVRFTSTTVREHHVCAEISRLTRSYIAYAAVQELAFLRREGAGTLECIQQYCEWRNALKLCTWNDVYNSARFRAVGRIMLPAWIFGIARILRRDSSRSYS